MVSAVIETEEVDHMKEISKESSGNAVFIDLSGRIDSVNVQKVEAEILEQLDGRDNSPVVLRADDLEYISSAGLRMLLHLKKRCSDLRITGVSQEVYGILEMTGFTKMLDVSKAYRKVSVDGCEIVGRGSNGTLYRIDRDNVVKVYNDSDALEDIEHERKVSRLALVMGIPTAISYDVVQVGDTYGAVFELLNAKSFSEILAAEPEKMDWCVSQYVDVLRKIHSIRVPDGELPDMRNRVKTWVDFLQELLPEEAGAKLDSLLKEIPYNDHMIHGDYHTKNLVLQGDEVLLIDMDTLAVGHPIFDLASMYNAFKGFTETDPEIIRQFQGIDAATSERFWHKALKSYLGTDDEEKIRQVEDKARILGYSRLIRRSIRRNGLEDPQESKRIHHWKEELLELLKKTDTLLFAPFELHIDASVDRLHEVMDFVRGHLKDAGWPKKQQLQIGLAVEEIFVNIASYAYAPDHGNAQIRVELKDDPAEFIITFTDQGRPFDPLESREPDITLPAEERPIGGLGIFMARQAMDDILYEYKDGNNILKLKKLLAK